MSLPSKLYAKLNGYFWLPCPMCGEYFGGHQIGGTLIRERHAGLEGLGVTFTGRSVCSNQDCIDRADQVSRIRFPDYAYLLNEASVTKPMNGIELGSKVNDTITGCSGIVVAITYCLNGCRRATIQPQALHEGRPIDQQTFDIEQLELLESGSMRARARLPSGGPTPGPTRASAPK